MSLRPPELTTLRGWGAPAATRRAQPTNHQGCPQTWTLSDGTRGTTADLVRDPRNTHNLDIRVIWKRMAAGERDARRIWDRRRAGAAKKETQWVLTDGTTARAFHLASDPRNVHGHTGRFLSGRLQTGHLDPAELFAPKRSRADLDGGAP